MLDTLPTFIAVAKTASFTKAARQLHVSTAAISKTILRLERELGIAVFYRTTRTVSLTEAGQNLLESAQRIIAEQENIIATIARSKIEPSGTLTVAMPASLGAQGRGRYSLTRACVAFAQKYPLISMRTVLSDDRVDLVREQMDVAVRISPLEDTSLKIHIISPCPFVLVAARPYLRRMGTPIRVTDLKTHTGLAYQNQAQPNVLRYQDAGGRTANIHIPCGFASNNGDQLITATLAGMGIALLPRLFIEDDLATGRLVHILPDLKILPDRYLALYMPHEGTQPAKTQAFVDFMVSWFAACPGQTTAPP